MLLASHALVAVAMLSHRDGVAAAPLEQGLLSISHTGLQDEVIAMSVAGAADHKLQDLRTHPATLSGHSDAMSISNGGPNGGGFDQHILTAGDAGTSNMLPDDGAVNMLGGHGRGKVNVGNAVALWGGGAFDHH
jgi:hypothetical protein